MKKPRRYVCHLRGHKWGKETKIKGKTYRGCNVCPQIDIQMVLSGKVIWVPVIEDM
jgi:hypothetical protein